MKLPEFLGLIGIFIALACIAIFFYASSDAPPPGAVLDKATKITQDNVVRMTWIFTPFSFLYALLVGFFDELSGASALELRKTYNKSAENIHVSIPSGAKS